MKIMIRLVLLILGAGLQAATAQAPAAAVIEFDSGRWEASGGKVVEFLGRKAFMGTATLKDVVFENGVIEFDVAASTDRARSYPGVVFRSGPDRRWERFYIRPHRSALYGDVLQYVAAFNGVDSWQFYSGPGATATAVIPVNRWLHVRLEVAGVQARVFLGDSAQPALVIPRLKHGLSKGAIGVMGPADGTAYFSNFTVRADEGLAFDPPPPVDEVPGVVRDWKVSRPFPAVRTDLDAPLEAQDLGDPAWRALTAEPGGLVDIARLYPRSAGPDLVYARTVIESERDEIRKYDFGYSDVATVFLDGRPVFSGNSQYQGRDSSFLGVVGWFDAVFLPLKKGRNELTVAVAEVSGGWGFMIRDASAVFAVPGLDRAWETDKVLSTPESAAYDPARDCLYVSNYDPYAPSGAERRQSVSRLSPDGRIEALRWVDGLANPTGLVVVKDRLFVVERRAIAEINIPQAKIVSRSPIPGAVLPNDIAADPDGSLYISDSQRAAIYKWTAGQIEEWIADPRLARPNGVCVDGSRLLVGTSADGCLKSVDLQTREIKTIACLGPGTIDGIERAGNGLYLVSHNEGRLFRVNGRGEAAKLLDLTVVGTNAADFAYAKNRLFVPAFAGNRVLAYDLKLSTLAGYRTDDEETVFERRRDERFGIDRGLDTLGIGTGMTVGEVGAGSGYLVFKLSERVGPQGRVWAEEIAPRFLGALERRAAARGLENIEPRIGEPDDPKLPPSAFDFIFMHATIQFVEKRIELFDHLVPCLKPGGKVVVIESEGDRAMSLDGKPFTGMSRAEYLALFNRTRLHVDRIDDTTMPHHTIFVLSRRPG